MSLALTFKKLVDRFGVRKATVLVFVLLFILRETVGKKLWCYLRNQPPLIMPFPIVGNFPHLCAPLQPPGNHKVFFELAKKYGPVYSIYLGGLYGIVLTSPEGLYEAMKTRNDDYSERPILPAFKEMQQETGVIGSNGKKWRLIRTMLQHRATSKQKGLDSEPFVTEEITATLFWLRNKTKDDASNFDLRLLLRKQSMNIGFRYLLSSRFNDDMSSKFYQTQEWIRAIFAHLAAGNPSDFMPILRLFPNNNSKQASNAIQNMNKLIDSEIDGHRKLLPNKSEDTYDVMDFMIKAQEEAIESKNPDQMLTDVDIRVSISDLMFGSLDAFANTVEWLVYVLANYPEKQKKLHEELDQIIGNDRLPCVNDIEKLKYTMAVFLEIVRMKHFAATGVPHKTSCDTKMLGFDVPKGTHVLYSIWALHHDPKHWKDPDEFIPERFLPGGEAEDLYDTLMHPEKFASKPESYRYLPYGHGKRRCIGFGLARIVVWLNIAIWFHCFEFVPPISGQKLDIDFEHLDITLLPLNQRVNAVPRPAARLLTKPNLDHIRTF